MHKGEDSAFYLKKGFKVIAFEASPELAKGCRKRFSTAIANGELILIEGAIVDVHTHRSGPGSVPFYENTGNSVWGTVDSAWAERNEQLGASSEVIDVHVVDFDECLRQYGIPYYMKIDIEGMDRVCLNALLPFEHKPDFVSIEAEKVSYTDLQSEIRLLQQLGYTRFSAVQQSGISLQTEPNPCKEGNFANHTFQEGSSGLFGEDLPARWKDARQVLKQYRSILLQYRLFGDSAWLPNHATGRYCIKALSKVLGKPVPGWYDTHARHASATAPQ